MDVLVDASILIDSERGRLDLTSSVQGRDEDSFVLSIITASELLHGVHRARNADQRTRRRAFVEAVITQFPMLNIDLDIARAHAQLRSELASRGEVIGPHDLWLAASCLAHGLSIATANAREFERVPGLSVELWC